MRMTKMSHTQNASKLIKHTSMDCGVTQRNHYKK